MTIARFIILLLLVQGAMAQQTNVIFGNVGDYGLVPQANVTVTATLLRPNPRQIGNVQVRVDPVAAYTDASGAYSFTNFQWGFYQLDVSGQGTTFRFNVWTNTLGSVPIGSLITNTASLPPNTASNYYTMPQVDALIAGIALADQKVFQIANQGATKPTAFAPAVLVTTKGGLFSKTNSPLAFDANGWDQLIADRP